MNEIASRYGQALYSLCLENNNLNSMQEEAKNLRSILIENADFVMVLNSPFLTKEERIDMVDKSLNGFSTVLLSLIKILVENSRVNILDEVLLSFNSYCNEYRGVIEGIVFSTIPLDEQTITEIEEKISLKEQTKVELYNRIDPSLIGGIKVTINNHVYDGSIKTQLETMKSDLLK